MAENVTHSMSTNRIKLERFKKTINFLKRVEPDCKNIFDLGVKNRLSEELTLQGYNVQNTQGEDLIWNQKNFSVTPGQRWLLPSKYLNILFPHSFC